MNFDFYLPIILSYSVSLSVRMIARLIFVKFWELLVQGSIFKKISVISAVCNVCNAKYVNKLNIIVCFVDL